MKVKKSLSVEDDFLKIAEDRAKSLNLNFTTYIQILINQDLGMKGIDHPEVGVNRYLKDRKHKIEEVKQDTDQGLFRSAAKEAMALMDNF